MGILDWLPGFSIMGRKGKLFVGHLTILHLKSSIMLVIAIRLMSGLLGLLCILCYTEGLLSRLLMSKRLTKGSKNANSPSMRTSLSQVMLRI